MNTQKYLIRLFLILIIPNISIFIQNTYAGTNTKPVTIFTIGDSTMADYTPFPTKAPMFGWGQVFQNYFDPEKVLVKNHGRSGRSGKTFISDGFWSTVLSQLSNDDYVFIQFGHNDEKDSNLDEYRENLAKFVNETRTKGAIPVLLTPTSRRTFNSNGIIYDSHIKDGKDYPSTMRKLSEDSSVELLDITKSSMQLVQSLGLEGSKVIFLWLDSSEHPNYPNGSSDNTHFSEYGANEMAKLVINSLKEQNSKLILALKEPTKIQIINDDNLNSFFISNKFIHIKKPLNGILNIYNLSGILIKTTNINHSDSNVDLNDINNGLYLLHLKLNDKIISSKILI